MTSKDISEMVLGIIDRTISAERDFAVDSSGRNNRVMNTLSEQNGCDITIRSFINSNKYDDEEEFEDDEVEDE